MFGHETFHSFVLEEIVVTEHQFGQNLVKFIQQSQAFFKKNNIRREQSPDIVNTICQLLWPISQWSLEFARQLSEHSRHSFQHDQTLIAKSPISPKTSIYMSPDLAILFVDRFARLNIFDDFCIPFTYNMKKLDIAFNHQGGEYHILFQEWQSLPLFGAMTIKDFLHKPLQRLTKYPLLMSRLLKEMDRDDVHFKMIEQTLSDISRHIQNIEKAQLKRDCLELEKHLQQGGHLVGMDENNMNEDRRKPKDHKQRQMYFIDVVQVGVINNRRVNARTVIPKWMTNSSIVILCDSMVIFARHQIRQYEVNWKALQSIFNKDILDIQFEKNTRSCKLISRPSLALSFENVEVMQMFVASFHSQQHENAINRYPLNKSRTTQLASDDASLLSPSISFRTFRLNQLPFYKKSNESIHSNDSQIINTQASAALVRPITSHKGISVSQDRNLWRRATSKFKRNTSYITPIQEASQLNVDNSPISSKNEGNHDQPISHKRAFQDES